MARINPSVLLVGVLIVFGCGDSDLVDGTAGFGIGGSDQGGAGGDVPGAGGSPGTGGMPGNGGNPGTGGTGPVSPIPGVEIKCVALDADPNAECICSEPLDVDQSITGGVTNFNDSPPSHDCGGALDTGRPEATSLVGESRMPPGNGVDRVLRLDGGGIWKLRGKTDIPPGVRRLCTRYYFRVSGADGETEYDAAGKTASSSNGCSRNKLGQINMSGGGRIQSAEGSSSTLPPSYTDFSFSWVAGGDDYRAHQEGGGLDFGDCQDGWCRHESCISGNFDTGQGLHPQMRITQVNTGTSYIAEREGELTNVDGGGVGLVWIGNLFRQNETSVGGSGKCDGFRDISHAIQTVWFTDEEQWPGAACEIEPDAPGCS